MNKDKLSGFAKAANTPTPKKEKEIPIIRKEDIKFLVPEKAEKEKEEDDFDKHLKPIKKVDKKLMTFHAEKELLDIVTYLGEKAGRKNGGKSGIINDALRKVFKEKGLL